VNDPLSFLLFRLSHVEITWSSRVDDAELEFGSKLFMIYTVMLAVVIVSFVVGMVTDKVLEYGSAGLIGICALMFSFCTIGFLVM
jgi:hypothetical protein